MEKFESIIQSININDAWNNVFRCGLIVMCNEKDSEKKKKLQLDLLAITEFINNHKTIE